MHALQSDTCLLQRGGMKFHSAAIKDAAHAALPSPLPLSHPPTLLALELIRSPPICPNLPPPQMSSSHYCLATAGDGWGTRLSEAVLAGCVPLLAQPAVLMPFEDILAYESFSLRLAPEEVASLPTRLASEDPPCMHLLTTARYPPFPTGRIAADVARTPRTRCGHAPCWATVRAPRVPLGPHRPCVQPNDPLPVPPGSRARRSVEGRAERQLCLARGSAARRHATSRDPSACIGMERGGGCGGGCGGRCAGRHAPHSRLVPSRARTCRREGHCSAPPSQSGLMGTALLLKHSIPYKVRTIEVADSSRQVLKSI